MDASHVSRKSKQLTQHPSTSVLTAGNKLEDTPHTYTGWHLRAAFKEAIESSSKPKEKEIAPRHYHESNRPAASITGLHVRARIREVLNGGPVQSSGRASIARVEEPNSRPTSVGDYVGDDGLGIAVLGATSEDGGSAPGRRRPRPPLGRPRSAHSEDHSFTGLYIRASMRR